MWFYVKECLIVFALMAVIIYEGFIALLAFNFTVKEDCKHKEVWFIFCMFVWPFMACWCIGKYLIIRIRGIK